MKKNLLVIALMATSAFVTSAIAADGAVNFTGSITDAACTVDTDSLNQTLDMGKISRSAFKAAGDIAGTKGFKLVLKNCPDTVTGAVVRFDGNQAAGDNGILALTAGQKTAQNVGIQITDAQNKVVPLYSDSSIYALQSTGTNTLNFRASYIALSNAVTVGEANAVTQFTIVYQ